MITTIAIVVTVLFVLGWFWSTPDAPPPKTTY